MDLMQRLVQRGAVGVTCSRGASPPHPRRTWQVRYALAGRAAPAPPVRGTLAGSSKTPLARDTVPAELFAASGMRYGRYALAGRFAPAPPIRGTLPVPLRLLRHLMLPHLDCLRRMPRRPRHLLRPLQCSFGPASSRRIFLATEACAPGAAPPTTFFSGGPGATRPRRGVWGAEPAHGNVGLARRQCAGRGGRARPQKCSTRPEARRCQCFNNSGVRRRGGRARPQKCEMEGYRP